LILIEKIKFYYILFILFLNIIGLIYFNKILLKWGLGIGDWGFGPIPNPQSPIPNPQSPFILKNIKSKINLKKY